MTILKNAIMGTLSLLLICNIAQAQQNQRGDHLNFVPINIVVLDKSVSKSQCKSMFTEPLLSQDAAHREVLIQQSLTNPPNWGFSVSSNLDDVNLNNKTQEIPSYFIGFTKQGVMPEKIIRMNKYCLAVGVLEKN